MTSTNCTKTSAQLELMIKNQVWEVDSKRTALDPADPQIPVFGSILERCYGGNKVRITAGNYKQNRFTCVSNGGNTSKWFSLSIDTLEVLLSIAVYEKRFISRIEIVNAYHNCVLPENYYKIMKFDKIMTKCICKLDSSYSTQVNQEDEHLYVKLLTTVYGALEFAELFYNYVKSILCSAQLNFEVNTLDRCVFNKKCAGRRPAQLTVAIHVDHLIVTCVDEDEIYDFKNTLKGYFENAILYDESDNAIEHLGVTLYINENNTATVGMLDYIFEILATSVN
jgi:Reverse transcriptase (RNA-dependent DNA polymerase)